MFKKGDPLPRGIRVLFLVRLINSMGNFIFPFLTLFLTVKLGWTAAAAGAFMTAMAFCGGLAMLAGGKLGDAFGRRRVILSCHAGAVAIFAACLATGISPALPYLIAAANVSLSATWPVFNAMVADLAPAEQRRRAFSLLYWGNNIGFSIGPLMAGFLFSRYPSLMFAGNATALLAVSFLLWRFVPETLPSREEAERAEGSAEAAERGGFLSALGRRPVLLGFALAMAVMNFVYAQHQFSLPVFLSERLGEGGPKVFGGAMTVNGLTVVAATAPLTALLGRLDSLGSMAVASLLYAAGFGMLLLVGSPIAASLPAVFVVYASTVVWTLGEIVSATNANVFIASRSPLTHRGRVNSAVTWISGSGLMLCPAISGAFIGERGIEAVWILAVVLAAIGALLMALLRIADLRAGPAART